ncbi:GNAT family N-acetyltransferase [Candidatus Eisenbacteria bacterium]|uniref:GNAT family N-acetyltransferase n=1 Tax=Eiseniibacteriota bacterium TaxID=2212470 RepID=A0ABV6YJQ4_UNCEI
MSEDKQVGSNATRVRLEELVPNDFPSVRPWIDPDIFPIFREPVDDEQLERLLTKHEDGRPTSLGYRIVLRQSAQLVGLVHAILDWKNHLAHVGQIVVGDPTLRNQGLGTESLRLLLGICFDRVGVHRAQLFVDEPNVAAVACYKKAGFVVEGLMREASRRKGAYVSWYSMSMLRREWQDSCTGRDG